MNKNEILKIAKKIAINAHFGQKRKVTNRPYIEHVQDVAKRVSDDIDCEIVAWLHDVIEDSKITLSDMERMGIPKEHLETVSLLTKKDSDYDQYIVGIKESETATRVKIADIISNLSDTPTKKQIKKYGLALTFLAIESK